MACTASWALNGRLVMLLLSRCGEAYELGTQPVRAAAQAAASQTLTAFCTFLGISHFYIKLVFALKRLCLTEMWKRKVRNTNLSYNLY